MKLILTQTLKNYKFAFEDLETEGKVGGGGQHPISLGKFRLIK